MRVRRRLKKARKNNYSHIDWDKASRFFYHETTAAHARARSEYPSVKEVLHVLAAAGSVGLLFVFPGAAAALGTFTIDKKSYSRWRTKHIVQQLGKQKFVSIQEHADKRVTVKITKEGMARALTYELESLHLKKPAAWDKKWRVIIFDIPNTYKRVRDIFRLRLKQLGLYQLQESVYVSPYPCFDEIEFLRELYSVSFTVRYFVAEKLEGDADLIHHFNLS